MFRLITRLRVLIRCLVIIRVFCGCWYDHEVIQVPGIMENNNKKSINSNDYVMDDFKNVPLSFHSFYWSQSCASTL